MPMNQYLPVGAIVRRSEKNNDESCSIDAHIYQLQNYADHEGLEIVQWYILDGVSGEDVLEHPEVKRMLSDQFRGNIRALLFTEVSRLARSVYMGSAIEYKFRANGGYLINVSKNKTTRTAQDRYDFYCDLADAEKELEQHKFRSREGQKRHLERNLNLAILSRLGGKIPFGYRLSEDKSLDVNPELIPVVKELFNRYLLWGNVGSVVEHLNQKFVASGIQKIPSFNVTTVKRILKSPIYKGQLYINRTQAGHQKNQWINKPPEEWILTQTPAIVSEDEWNSANQLSKTVLYKGRPSKELGTGFVYCFNCGLAMKICRQRSHFICSVDACCALISLAEVEESVINMLHIYARHGVKAGKKLMQQEINHQESLIRVYATQLDELDNAFRHRGKFNPSRDFDLYYAEKHHLLEQSLEEAERNLQNIVNAAESCDTNESLNLSVLDYWKGTPLNERQQLASRMINRMFIMHNGDIAVSSRLPSPIRVA